MPFIAGAIVAASQAGVKKVASDILALGGTHSAAAIMAKQITGLYDQTIREVGLSAYNVVRAWLATELGVPPDDKVILGLMAEAADSHGFPARAVRLIEAARRAPSDRRRERLAAVLYGAPFTSTSDDDRDRVDMLVERLICEDIDLLARICAFDSEVIGGPRAFYVVGDVTRSTRIAGMKRSANGPAEIVGAFVPSGAAFTSLEAQGCIYRSTGFAESITIDTEHGSGIHLEVTALGRLLLQALRDVGVGPIFADRSG